MVLHFGSNSIKFGLASQVQPFMVPNIIAYPGNSKVFNVPPQQAHGADEEMNDEEESKVINTDSESTKWIDDRIQADFETQASGYLPEIVSDLRNKSAHMIDARAMKQLKKGNVSYK